ncbi:hypothetical protein [Thermomonas flagellata]|uniref:hypothetical protein n=1 Tax=Thermomonas flagellata TaxID=2888524 RepID=UPI001F04D076|nr:hypothetical protein [Thermomonas flagellata]
MPSIRRLLATGGTVAMLLAAGCRNAQEPATGLAAATLPAVPAPALPMAAVQAPAAPAADTTGVPIPADFPADVYLPPQRAVDGALATAEARQLQLATRTPPARLAGEIERAMQAAGWTREMAVQSGQGSLLLYRKQQRQAVYQFGPAADGLTRLAVRTGRDG